MGPAGMRVRSQPQRRKCRHGLVQQIDDGFLPNVQKNLRTIKMRGPYNFLDDFKFSDEIFRHAGEDENIFHTDDGATLGRETNQHRPARRLGHFELGAVRRRAKFRRRAV